MFNCRNSGRVSSRVAGGVCCTLSPRENMWVAGGDQDQLNRVYMQVGSGFDIKTRAVKTTRDSDLNLVPTLTRLGQYNTHL